MRKTAARALDALHAERFDLMLLDIQMPELNGYEVLEQLKADPALRDIPVIVLSASDETERVARCIEMGAEDYLPKPFDPVLLQARIGASLEKKRLRDREVSYLRQIQEEKQRSDDLLHIILPHDVAEELKTTNAVKPRRFENVGVLFCDIVGFTAYCDQHAPEEILTHLQALVEAFERIVGESRLGENQNHRRLLHGHGGSADPADQPGAQLRSLRSGHDCQSPGVAAALADSGRRACRPGHRRRRRSPQISIRRLGRHREHRRAHGTGGVARLDLRDRGNLATTRCPLRRFRPGPRLHQRQRRTGPLPHRAVAAQRKP